MNFFDELSFCVIDSSTATGNQQLFHCCSQHKYSVYWFLRLRFYDELGIRVIVQSEAMLHPGFLTTSRDTLPLYENYKSSLLPVIVTYLSDECVRSMDGRHWRGEGI